MTMSFRAKRRNLKLSLQILPHARRIAHRGVGVHFPVDQEEGSGEGAEAIHGDEGRGVAAGVADIDPRELLTADHGGPGRLVHIQRDAVDLEAAAMELVVDRDEGVHVEELLLVGRRPEVEHHDLGALRGVGQFRVRAGEGGQVHVEEAHLLRFLEALVDLQEVRTTLRLALEGLHVAGFRIDGLEGVADAAEDDAVRGLVEHGEAVVHPVEQHGNGSQGLGMLHDVADAAAVVIDVAAAEFLVRVLGVDEAGHVGDELRVVVLDLLQEDGLLGTIDRIEAQGVGVDGDVVALLDEEGRDLAVAVVQVDEFRAAFLDRFGLVGEGAVGIGLDGVQHLVLIDIQEFDDHRGIGLVLQGSVDDGLRAAGRKKECRAEGGEDSNGFHRLPGWNRRSFSSLPGRG